MRLVDNEVLPRNATQTRLLLQHGLVRAHQRVELVRPPHLRGFQKFLARLVPLVLRAAHAHGANGRTPPPEFLDPISHHGLGDDDDVRSLHPPCLAHVGQERNGLQCLSQSHLVRQYSVNAVIVQFDHPVQTLQLVLVHRAAFPDAFGLVVEVDGATGGLGRFEELGVLFGLGHAVFLAAGSLLFGFGVVGSDGSRQKVSEDLALPHQVLKLIERTPRTLLPLIPLRLLLTQFLRH
mmetsp:Transcript_23353/g.44306  ORF Transcript_23353/g.44306 Transcript_23353/m.44306 type:complete len:236 (+) Transcript_23353:3085-3792(+)